MPTYEYRCKDCGQHVEVVQSFSDDPLTECGTCGGELRKVFSPVGIVFKGSGFYKTDSRSGGSKTASVPEGKKEPKPDSSGSSGSSDSSKSSGSSGSESKIA
jgi:putative FmdB family regulatory protein